MAFDGIVTKLITTELNNFILNGKINKIFEPNKNEIILALEIMNLFYYYLQYLYFALLFLFGENPFIPKD